MPNPRSSFTMSLQSFAKPVASSWKAGGIVCKASGDMGQSRLGADGTIVRKTAFMSLLLLGTNSFSCSSLLKASCNAFCASFGSCPTSFFERSVTCFLSQLHCDVPPCHLLAKSRVTDCEWPIRAAGRSLYLLSRYRESVRVGCPIYFRAWRLQESFEPFGLTDARRHLRCMPAHPEVNPSRPSSSWHKDKLLAYRLSRKIQRSFHRNRKLVLGRESRRS